VKTKFEHGAVFDMLNKDELIDGLHRGYQNWLGEVTRGITMRRFTAQGTIASTAVTIGGPNQDERLGPEPGFVWSVRRLAVSNITLGTDSLAIFVNDNGPSSLIMPRAFNMTGQLGAQFFDGNQLVLNGGDQLLFTGTGLNATGIVTIAGMAMELPITMMYKLI
jgi:hypothetical protein